MCTHIHTDITETHVDTHEHTHRNIAKLKKNEVFKREPDICCVSLYCYHFHCYLKISQQIL